MATTELIHYEKLRGSGCPDYIKSSSNKEDVNCKLCQITIDREYWQFKGLILIDNDGFNIAFSEDFANHFLEFDDKDEAFEILAHWHDWIKAGIDKVGYGGFYGNC